MAQDDTIQQIRDYLKEANEKNWPEYIIKNDLGKIIDSYTDPIVRDAYEELQSIINTSYSLNEVKEKFLGWF